MQLSLSSNLLCLEKQFFISIKYLYKPTANEENRKPSPSQKIPLKNQKPDEFSKFPWVFANLVDIAFVLNRMVRRWC